MFSNDGTGDNISVWEVTPGGRDDPRVQYIINRIKGRYKNPDLGVRRYPLGVLDNDPCTPEMPKHVEDGAVVRSDTGWEWTDLGNDDCIATNRTED
jgi:hypothetical protein